MCAASRVVPEAFCYAVAVGQDVQKATAVATGVEDAAGAEAHVDRVEHGLQDESMLFLHRPVLGRAAPVGLFHSQSG
jgi:hypothetical protein